MASNIEISDEMEALSGHYFRVVRSPDQHVRWVQDYIDELKGFPVETIRAACRSWRLGKATKFPLVGELVELARRVSPLRTGGEKPWVWSPATQEEYQSMTLREKARECALLAEQARSTGIREALRLGWKRNVADAPDIYGRWTEAARSHAEEANRLKAQVKSYDAA